jgi:undecaprenyl-diphosphatase
MFGNLSDVGVLLIIMGFILFNTRFIEGRRKLDKKDSILIGIAQAAALAPGISRSGVTITVGLLRKIRKEQVFVFSFMLAIPAIIGATAYELYQSGMTDLGSYAYAVSFEMLVGAAVAAVVGYLSLKVLKDFIIKESFYKFGYYCWAVGFLVLLYTFFA